MEGRLPRPARAAHAGHTSRRQGARQATERAGFRNQWYVAAFSREIGDELFARTVCDEPLVLWRAGDEVVALADRCVPRRFPLSRSRRLGDTVVCGYHGFTYDAAGTCVAVPGQTRILRTARVRSYPVVEQDSFVWVWIGERELADPATIPRAPCCAHCGKPMHAGNIELLPGPGAAA